MHGCNIFLTALVLLPALSAYGLYYLHRAKTRNRGRIWPLLLCNLLTLILLAATILLVGEIWRRFFVDESDAFGLSLVSQRWHNRHYRINGAGARDSIEYSLQIKHGCRRLTILGDSFTAGYGIKDVEKRFANLLRHRLGPAWEVHVIAGDGMDTGEEILQIKEAAEQGYELDILLLAYCLNDIADLAPDWQARLSRIYDSPLLKNTIVKNSFFLNMLACRLLAATNQDIANYYGFVHKAYFGHEWQIQQTRLSNLATFCKQSGTQLLVVTFPFLHRLGTDYEYQKTHENLDAFWVEQDIPHLDLLAVYRGHQPASLMVNSRDPHPNEYAHAMAAKAILARFVGVFSMPHNMLDSPSAEY